MLYSLIEIIVKECHIHLGLDLNSEAEPFIPQINGHRITEER